MEIPLSQLRFSNQEEQVWGMHAWRWIGRLAEESDWEYQTLTGPGMLYNFGELRGIKSLKKSQRLEIMPYSLGELRTFEKESVNPFAREGHTWSGNAGLDVKVGISSNFTSEGLKTRHTIEPLTNYMVARVQKDYHEGTTMIGGILTSANRFIKDPELEFLTRDAITGGLDLLHQWKQKNIISMPVSWEVT
jgi:hypothetical protein